MAASNEAQLEFDLNFPFVPCSNHTLSRQIKNQQNAHVLSILFHASTCFGPIRPSSGCVSLQNTLLSNVHVQYTSIYSDME